MTPHIYFNTKLYNLKAIKKTIQAYKGLAVFSLARNGRYIKVTLHNISPDVEPVIKDEFSNHVVALLKTE